LDLPVDPITNSQVPSALSLAVPLGEEFTAKARRKKDRERETEEPSYELKKEPRIGQRRLLD